MATSSEMETELAPMSQLKASRLSLTFLLRQSLFPLKPCSLKLTKAQPPESLSLTGCRRCYQRSQRSGPFCASEEAWLRSRQLSLEVEEEATTPISRGSRTLCWQPVSHPRLRRLCQGNGRGEPTDRGVQRLQGSAQRGRSSAAPAGEASTGQTLRLPRGTAYGPGCSGVRLGAHCCGRKGGCTTRLESH